MNYWHHEPPKYILDMCDEVLVNGTTYDHRISTHQGAYYPKSLYLYVTTSLINHNGSSPPARRAPWALGRKYQVTFCPDAGRVTVIYAPNQIDLSRLPSQEGVSVDDSEDLESGPISGNRGYHARSKVINLAAAYRLGTFATLNYRHEVTPEESRHTFTNYIRRLLRGKGGAPWLEITEYGGRRGRLHHHVLLEADFNSKEVKQHWHEGTVHILRLPTIDATRSTAGYLCKDFTKHPDERPNRNRYRKARSMSHPERTTRLLTESALHALLKEMGVNDVDWYFPQSPDSYVVKVGTWDPLNANSGFEFPAA